MRIPNLRRIKVTSQEELVSCLPKLPGGEDSVMVVTFNRNVPDKHLSTEQVLAVVESAGWKAGPRFTLNATLIGQVISRTRSAR